MIDVVVFVLLAVGTVFVVVGTVGLLRFPDLPTRLHAVAKADNLGLGFIVAALIVDVFSRPDDGSPLGIALKLVLIWVLALLGTAANSHLLAGHARAGEIGRGETPEATTTDTAASGSDPVRRRGGGGPDAAPSGSDRVRRRADGGPDAAASGSRQPGVRADGGEE